MSAAITRLVGLAVGLAALAIVGHWAALQLIDVKPYAAYQHYLPWRDLVAARPGATSILVTQLAAIGILCWRIRHALRGLRASLFGGGTALVLLALAAFPLAVPTESADRYAGELLLSALIAALATLNLTIIALVVPDAVLARLVLWIDDRLTLRPGDGQVKPWDRLLPGVVALWLAAAAALASAVAFERLPHIDDSVSNYFQAKYFAAGRLFLPSPPDAASFQVDQTVVEGGRWYGYAFPGWPVVLGLGVLAGRPWLVNPLLGGLLILAGHALVRRRSDRATANLTALLLSTSPWLIFMSAEFMSHPLSAVLVAVAALAFDVAAGGGRHSMRWSVAAGLTTGALFLTRALDTVTLAAALGVTVMIDRRLRPGLRAIAIAAPVAAAIASLMFPYNRAVTGRATYPPHLAWSDSRWGPGVDRMGFGRDIGIRAWPNLDPLPGHGPVDVVLNANKNAFMTNVDLFGWAPGSLLFLWLAIGIGRWRRSDALFVAIPASYLALYSAYWFSGGPDIGARYWYPSIVSLAALSARGIQMLAAVLGDREPVSRAGARVGVLVLAACATAVAATLPWRATTKYYRYRGIGGEVRALAASRPLDGALVFVRAEDKQRDYASAFSLNPPTLDDRGTIYAFDAGPEHRARVVAHFADRPVWVIGRDATGRLGVIAGPLPPGTVPRPLP